MAKTIDIVVPDLGDFDDVEVIELLVAPGDAVEREDGLVTLETDKAAMDVPALESGTIEELSIAVGDKVSAGDVIGKLTVEVSDTVVITPAIKHAPSGDTTVLATPAKADAGGAPKSAGVQTLVVPDLGDFDDVEVIEVHISKGDQVAVDDSLVTLETDKAAMDVPAIVGGRIESVLVKVGDKVSAGSSLAIIEAVAGQGPEAPTPAPDPSRTRSLRTQRQRSRRRLSCRFRNRNRRGASRRRPASCHRSTKPVSPARTPARRSANLPGNLASISHR